MVSGHAVRAALEDWIVAAKVRSEFIGVVGGAVPAKRFFVHVKGDSAGAPRAMALARALRLPGGGW
eukprot:565152-Pyramimonas_sp.AAC.1